MTEHYLNVVVRLENEGDWELVNHLLFGAYENRIVSAGTGFGRRDVQIEVPDDGAGWRLAAEIRFMLADAGLGDQLEECEPWEDDELWKEEDDGG